MMTHRQEQHRLRYLLREHLLEVKGGLAAAALCTVLLAATDLLRPWPLKIIFDYVLLNKPIPRSFALLQVLLAHGKVWTIIVISFGIIAIAVVKSFSAYWQTHVVSNLGFRFAHTLRRTLFVHLQRLSLSSHARLRSGELLTNITSDTSVLRDVLVEVVLTFAAEFLSLAGMLVVMVGMNWRLSLIALAISPVLVLLSLLRYRKIRDSARRQRKAEGQIASRTSEVLSSMQVVQAFGREDYEQQRFESQSSEALKESMRTVRLEAVAARALDLVTALGTWAVVLVGSVEAMRGRMPPGTVLVFASYMTSMASPIRNLAKLSSRMSRASVTAQKIGSVLDLEPEVGDVPGAIPADGIKGGIAFQEVSFAYPYGDSVLKNVSFRIAPGKHVALLGRSGAGKSTLSALLLRLYDPQSGSITVDEVDIRQYQRESLRREIGIVLQDSLLFGTTVHENIAYGKLNATTEEVIAAAKAANAHEFIARLERGYETVIGERGASLSGGERQRIAIARTFIRNMPILILDEPMTGLDVESESAVRDALRRLMAARTSILITHDLDVAAEADLILLLADGEIVAQGSHADLLACSQTYRDLWSYKAIPDVPAEVGTVG
ncbi:MAG TPA: ABC transporter ATP-binding protein [Candidatus Acidoferrales bacterium]|nr:ABC transporter ATP-binding protein [Candidatus Acidoferrales bacterium]